jgi:hypothetical protein
MLGRTAGAGGLRQQEVAARALLACIVDEIG